LLIVFVNVLILQPYKQHYCMLKNDEMILMKLSDSHLQQKSNHVHPSMQGW